MKIGLDFDGVIADCGKLKSDGALKLYGLEIPPEKFKKEIVIGEGHLTAEQYLSLQQSIYGTREIGFLMELVPEVDLHLAKLLEDGHTLVVITSRGEKELGIAREWSELKGLSLEFIGVGGGRSKAEAAAGCDVYVDDDLDKLEPLVGIVPHLFLFGWGYNAAVEVDGVARRVTSWSDLYARVQDLS